MGRGQAKALEQSDAGFQRLFGSRRGRPEAPDDPGEMLGILRPDLDYEALAREAFTRHEEWTRTALDFLGIRSAWAEHLWWEPQYGHKVHLRPHAHSSYALCQPWEDEYGSSHGSAQNMQRAPRGSWSERQRFSESWEHCSTCERRFTDASDDKDRASMAEEVGEGREYPPLTKEREGAFLASLPKALQSVRTTATAPTEEEVQALLDEGYRQALLEECLTTISEDTFKGLLENYQQIRFERMPRGAKGGLLSSLPMEISEFMPPETLRSIYDKSLLASAQENVDWPQLRRDTAEAISKCIRRELAKRELALLTEDE